jgi:flagellar biosynthetic protein FliR
MSGALVQALAPDRWPALVFIATRLGGMMLVAPLWSMALAPVRVRAAITVLLALALLPAAPPLAWPADPLAIPLPLAGELAIGIAIGLGAAAIVQGAALAGEVLSLQTGLSFASTVVPMPEAEVPAIGQIHSALAVLIYLAADGHLALLSGIAESLRALPPGGALDLAAGSHASALAAGSLFASAVGVAGPTLVALLAANVAIAMLSRAVPQLNAMLVSFPLTIALGLLVLGAALPLLGSALDGQVSALPDAPVRLGAFAPGGAR